jgi:phage shock protein PspC (stress-responsive transcriptional regulator)
MSAEPKKLYRSRTDRFIGGVAGGLGEFLSIDATLVRLLFAAAFFAGGVGPILYIAMIVIVPEEPYDTAPSEEVVEVDATDEE